MAGEPELKTATRQRIVSPLRLAWGLVIFMITLTVAWIYLSDDPQPVVETPAPVIALADEADEDTSSIPPATNAAVVEEELDEPQQTNTDTQSADRPEKVAVQPSTTIPQPTVSAASQRLENTQSPLTQAPNENLLIRGDNGLKPALGPDGLIAWKEYARPFAGSEDAPRIAILITDIGLNSRGSNAAIDTLPGQIDLALSPYGRNLQSWMDKARAKGHEGFLMLPTEPLNYPDNDPGPHTLIADTSPSNNLVKLDWLLSQVTGYVGVVNHMGSKFTASEEALTPVLTDLQSRGLMLVDSRSTRFSMAARVARNLNMPRAINDRYIDNVITSEEIQKQLAELEITANTFGAALGLARATPLSINEIAAWAETLAEKGIELVPVTAIANRQPVK
tara:strand:+ start:327658 stop:328836 length:1179 start_codon:yes stop_codon:yes gene_type:complete